MRKFFSSLFLVLFLSSLYAEKIKVGYYNLEPFMIEMGKDKKPTGITIDYYEKYVAPKLGVEIEWVGPLPFARLNSMLENQELDMLVNLSKTPDRASKFIFPEAPQSKIISCLTFLKDYPLDKITKPDDLFNKKIGYIVTGFVPPFLVNDKIAFELTSSEDYRKINLDKLINKRFEAVLDINYVSMLYYMKVNGYTDKVKTLLLPVDPSYVYAMFVKSEKGERLVKLFNPINAELTKAQVFESLTKKYLE